MISEANSLLPSPLWSGSVSAGYRTNDLCSGLGTVTLARAVLPQRLRNPRFSSLLLSLSVSGCYLSLAHSRQVGGDSTLRGPLNAPVRSNCSSRARCLLPAGSYCLRIPRAALIGCRRKWTSFPKVSRDTFLSALSLQVTMWLIIFPTAAETSQEGLPPTPRPTLEILSRLNICLSYWLLGQFLLTAPALRTCLQPSLDIGGHS